MAAQARWRTTEDMDTYSSMEEIARIIERLAKRTSLTSSTHFSFNSDNDLIEEKEYEEERGGYEDEGGGYEEEEEEEEEGEYLLEDEDDEQTRDILNGIGYKYKYSTESSANYSSSTKYSSGNSTDDHYGDGYLIDDDYDDENDSDEVFEQNKADDNLANIYSDDQDPNEHDIKPFESQTSTEFSSVLSDDLEDIMEEDETELSDYDNLHDGEFYFSGNSTSDLDLKVKDNGGIGEIVAEMLKDTSDPFVQKMLARFLVRRFSDLIIT